MAVNGVKRYTFEGKLESKAQLRQVEQNLQRVGISPADISYLYIPPKSQKGLELKRVTDSHRLASRGLLIGFLLGGLFSFFSTTQISFSWDGLVYAQWYVKLWLYGLLGAVLGFAAFFLIGLKSRSFQVVYRRHGEVAHPTILVSVNTSWEDQEKVKAVFDELKAKELERVDHHFAEEVGL